MRDHIAQCIAEWMYPDDLSKQQQEYDFQVTRDYSALEITYEQWRVFAEKC